MENREIKFEYGFKSVNRIVKKVYFLHEIPDIKQKCDVWDNLPIAYVRQFAGLKDKNGKEIYEGDIMQMWFLGVKSDIVRIVFRNGGFYILHKTKNNAYGDMGVKPFEKTNKCKHLEIIGNIYESPELTK